MPNTLHDDKTERISDQDLREITGVRAREEAKWEADAKADNHALSPEELADREANSDELDSNSGSDPNFNFRQEKKGVLSGGLSGLSTNPGVIAGMGVLGLIAIILIITMVLLSQLKVIHFGELLSATGYARFNGIMRERTTQDIFDASVVDSNGSVQVRGKSLVDRIKLRNVDNQLSQLGREGKFNIELENDRLTKVKFEGGEVSIDEIAKRYGADNYESLKGVRERMGVRAEFTKQLEAQVGENLSLEPRYVQGRIFKTVADKVGFKYNRWRNGGRDLLGKKPPAAIGEDAANSFEETSGKGTESGVETIDEATKELKDNKRLRKFVEDRGGTFDAEEYTKALRTSIEDSNVAKIGNIADTVSVGALTASIACMANRTFAKIPEIAEQNEASATKMGLQVLSARDQVKAHKVTTEAYGTAAAQLSGAEQSAAYQYQTNQPVNLAKAEQPKIIPDKTGIAELITNLTSPTRLAGGAPARLPWLSGLADKSDEEFCNFLLSPQGMATAAGIDFTVQVVLGFFTDGGEVAAEQGASRAAVGILLDSMQQALFSTVKGVFSKEGGLKLAGTLFGFTAYSFGLQMAAMSLGGMTFSGAEQGAAYYDRAAVGTNVLQNREVRSQYGRPIEKAEARGLDKQYAADLREGWNQKGFTSRYFAADNPFSLVGTASAYTPSTLNSSVGTLRKGLSSLGSIVKPFSSLGQGFGLLGGNSKVYAAETANYDPYGDQVQWGDSPDEQQKERFDESYRISENEKHISADQISALDQEIGPCFDPSRSQYDVNKDPKCSADRLSKDDAFRYRLYKRDENIVKSTEEDLTKSDDDSGGGGSNSGGTPTASIDPSLPTGSKEELIAQIKATGNVSNAGVLTTAIRQTTLAVLLKLAQKYKFTMGQGAHLNGTAVDLGNINGKGVPTGQDYSLINADADQFAVDAATLLPGKSWMGVPNDHYKEIANNIMRSKGGSSDLDTPWTTRATGPHFHLNCAPDAP